MTIARVPGLVSIIVPCFNREPYVVECLNSLIQQSYANIEIIIIDDASTDETVPRIKAWLESASVNSPKASWKERVQLLCLPRNVGYAGAVTTGMYLAKGEYIAMQDSDDLSHPERILKQVEFLRNNPNVGMVGAVYASFNDGEFEKRTRANWLQFGEKIKQKYALGKHCVCHGTILFRGHIFDEIGGPIRRVVGAEDFEYIARCISKRVVIDNIPEVLYYYRRHPDQRSRQFFSKKAKKE